MAKLKVVPKTVKPKKKSKKNVIALLMISAWAVLTNLVRREK